MLPFYSDLHVFVSAFSAIIAINRSQNKLNLGLDLYITQIVKSITLFSRKYPSLIFNENKFFILLMNKI